MIILDQVMLYVDNQEESANFWQDNFGFKQIDRIEQDNNFALVLQDQRSDSTKLVLQNKKVVKEMDSGVDIATPSLLFKATDDIEKIHQQLLSNDIKVGELVTFPHTNKRLFNFSDLEGNYFAIIEA